MDSIGYNGVASKGIKGKISYRSGGGIVGRIGCFRHSDRNAQAGDDDGRFVVEIQRRGHLRWVELFDFENIIAWRHLLENSHAIGADRAGKGLLFFQCCQDGGIMGVSQGSWSRTGSMPGWMLTIVESEAEP